MKSLAESTPSSSADFFGALAAPPCFVRGGVLFFRLIGLGLSGLGMQRVSHRRGTPSMKEFGGDFKLDHYQLIPHYIYCNK